MNETLSKLNVEWLDYYFRKPIKQKHHEKTKLEKTGIKRTATVKGA